MESHAKKCVERYCELANKTTQQLYKVSTPCIDDHRFKEERIEICWRIFKSMLSNCSEMGKLGTYWKTRYSMVSEQVARSITKWTKACDKRLSRLISSFITHVITNNIVMWETLQNNADWDCFKTPILPEISRIQNLHLVEHCAFSESQTFVSISWMCKNKLQFRTIQQNQKSFPWTQF